MKKTHTFSIFHLPQTLLAIAAMALLLNGCAVKQPVPPHRYPQKPSPTTPSPPPPSYPQPSISRPTVPPPPEPTSAAPISPPKLGAGSSLYASAKDAMTRGNYGQAEMMLERAIKIEPRNAHYWYTMAEVKYSQGQYSQTVHLCSKSKSLAGKNSQLLQLNDTLTAKARQRL